MNAMRRVFESADMNKDGKVDRAELGLLIRKLGHKTTEQEIKGIVDRADIDSDGEIAFTEFQAMMVTHYKEFFKAFDTNSDGRLSQSEIKNAMDRIGTILSHKEIAELIRAVDKDKDGQVNLEEFAALLAS